MEGIRLLDRSGGSGLRTLRLADAKRCQSLPRNRRAAAIVSAEHRVSHRLGDFVYSHGYGSCADLSVSSVQGPVTQPVAVPCTVGIQFLLEHHLLQFAGLWVRVPLADRAVDLDPADDFVLPGSGSTGRMAANSVSPLGEFCRISELWSMAAQSITESEKSAMSPCDPSLF